MRDHPAQRKTLVKGAAVFVATCLEVASGLLADHARQHTAGELEPGPAIPARQRACTR